MNEESAAIRDCESVADRGWWEDGLTEETLNNIKLGILDTSNKKCYNCFQIGHVKAQFPVRLKQGARQTQTGFRRRGTFENVNRGAGGRGRSSHPRGRGQTLSVFQTRRGYPYYGAMDDSRGYLGDAAGSSRDTPGWEAGRSGDDGENQWDFPLRPVTAKSHRPTNMSQK